MDNAQYSSAYSVKAANDPDKGPVPIGQLCPVCGKVMVRGPDGAMWCYQHGPRS